ncbi:MAG: stage III sporulation protein AF [Acutalibacteraceae bacterium]
MNGLSAWALSVSICAVIACVVEMMTADTKLEKTVRFVLGAFMLCAILIPVGSMVSEFSGVNFDSKMTYDISDSFNEQKISMLKDEIATLAESTLSKEQIYPQKVEVNMDISEDNCISMVSVTVMLDKKDREKAVKVTDTIKSQLGLECNAVVAD